MNLKLFFKVLMTLGQMRRKGKWNSEQLCTSICFCKYPGKYALQPMAGYSGAKFIDDIVKPTPRGF